MSSWACGNAIGYQPAFRSVGQVMGPLWAHSISSTTHDREALHATQPPSGLGSACSAGVMGNDARREGKGEWIVGQEPLFVLADWMRARKLAATCVQAMEDR